MCVCGNLISHCSRYEDVYSSAGKKYSADNDPLECSTLSCKNSSAAANGNGWNSTKCGIDNGFAAHAGTGSGFRLPNPNISKDAEDILYHLALGNKSHDLVEMFGDVKVKRVE